MGDTLLHLGLGSKDCADSTTRVLGNDKIVQHMYEFLPPNELKSCRAVCHKWRRIAEPTFKNQMRLCFYFGDCEIAGKKNSFGNFSAPTNLNEFFKDSHHEEPFEALSLGNTLPWPIPILRELFSTEGRFITNLTLNDVNLYPCDKMDDFIKILDLGSILQGIVLNLKRIDIRSDDGNETTRFILSTKFLSTVKGISLWNCTVEILPDYRIAPTYLFLTSTKFIGNFDTTSIILNEFIDFAFLKIMLVYDFNYEESRPRAHSLKIDLQGSCNLDTLGLIQINILNLDNSNWSVNFLSLQDVPFIRATDMKIKKFRSSGLIDVKHVPRSCEMLSLGLHSKFPEYENNLLWDFSLPNVKYLDLDSYNIVKPFFPQIIPCFPNLVELKLNSHTTLESAIIDMELIPKSVKSLTLHWNGFIFVGGNVRVLNNLVLQFGSSISANEAFEFANEVLNHFAPRNFFLFTPNPKASDGDLLLNAVSNKLTDRMIVGLFDLRASDHISSLNTKFLCPPKFGSAGEFYAFVNKKWEVMKHQ